MTMVTKWLTTVTFTTVSHRKGGGKLNCSHSELVRTGSPDAIVAISMLRAVQFGDQISVFGQSPSSALAVPFQDEMSAFAQLSVGKTYHESSSNPVYSVSGAGSPTGEPYPQQFGFLDSHSLQRQVEFAYAVHDSVQSH